MECVLCQNRIFPQCVQGGNGVKFFHTLQNRPEQHQHPRHKEAVPADKLLQTVHLFLSSIAAPNFSLRIIQNRTHPGALPNAPWPGPGRKAARPRPCPGWDKIRLPPLGSEAAGHSLSPALLPPPPYPGSPSRPAAIPHPWTSRSGVLPQFEHHIAHGCRTRNFWKLRSFRPLKRSAAQGFARVRISQFHIVLACFSCILPEQGLHLRYTESCPRGRRCDTRNFGRTCDFRPLETPC